MKTKMALLGAAAMICIGSPASAQSYAMDRGVWVVGGSASFSHWEASGLNGGTTSFSLFPDVGYFFIPGLLVVANLEYAHGSGTYSKSTRYGGGPGVTYYFIKGPAKLHPYLGASAFFGHNQFESSGVIYQAYSEDYSSWYASGGAAFLLARNVGVTGEAFYSQVHSSTGQVIDGSSSTITQYGLRFGMSVFIY